MRLSKDSNTSSRLPSYVDTLQAKGRLTFTAREAIKTIKITQIAFNRSAERLISKKRLIHPSRGFYVIVPVEHQLAGAPPVSWFIEELMKFHQQPYYVGLLTAAALHGAAHQSPQEFQVITTKALRPIRAGRARIGFLTKKWVDRTPSQMVRTPYGDIPVSTPEATAFDLVQYVRRAGRLSNVATTLIELSEKMDSKKLPTAADACGEVTVAQRLGYLLENFVGKKLTRELHQWVENQRPSFTPLRPNWKSELPQPLKIERWHLVVNDQVEPDV